MIIQLTESQADAILAIASTIQAARDCPKSVGTGADPTEAEMRDTVRELVIAKTKINRSAVVTTLSEYGVNRASAITADKLPDFIQKLGAITKGQES